ncbi:MAG: response regulator [Candidatus Abyssobacteria bacterium SURF_17]|uniref:histidine kinase n=1 Tax=Candidatus Abyssobacteria bacterium SURF_17 TaxID=2093361 RepID=A0A419F3Q0_9BACT|nr:MAG: response regulator [Candidatus Abyssubacteria bacterium SURF_17]
MDIVDHRVSFGDFRLRYEETISQLCLITRLNESVARLDDLPGLCFGIVSAIIEFTPAENCSIMLREPQTGSLNLVVAKGRSDEGSFFGAGEMSTTVLGRGEGAAGWAAQHAELLSIDDCDLDDRFIHLSSAVKEVNSVICAPIVAAGSVIGVINCSHPRKSRFSEADKRNVALVADHAAVLLQKALVVDRIKNECVTLKKRLEEQVGCITATEESVTELREQLYISEKFATLGELLAGVAHELNNRVAPILIYSQMLQQQMCDEKEEKRLRVIEESAVGAKAILETLLHYSRPGEQEREPVNLNQTLQNTLTLIEYKMRNQGIELSLDLCPQLPPANVTEQQMVQVFLNIINNAVAAMENTGGTLKIKSTFDRGNIKVIISDTGPGIPGEISEKIFEPFFTTKESGKGTGLGLSISKRFVEDHKGRIYLDTAAGSGATFVVEVPRNGIRKENSEKHGPFEMRSHDAARILVVDDDSTIRDVIRDVLGSGYEIEFATDGHDATTKIATALFDLLMVDYHMPGLDGRQLYEWVSSNHPSLRQRTIFSTGDIYHEEIRNFIESTGCRFLIKPFSTADLRQMVSSTLSA